MKTEFSERLKSLEAAREPFRKALQTYLNQAGQPDLLISSPGNEIANIVTPASVLAVFDNRWIQVEENSFGGTSTTQVDFANTLWVELTAILLYGRLSITYARDSALHRVEIVFNTSRVEYYRDAAERVLLGIRGLTGSTARDNRQVIDGVAKLSFKFRSALYDMTPPGERLKALLSWPMLTEPGHFGAMREVASAGMLVLTEHTLLIIQEELKEANSSLKKGPHYGKITEYIPLQRLSGCALHDTNDTTMSRVSFFLSVDGATKGELGIKFPTSLEIDVQVFLEKLTNVVQARRC